MLSLVFEVVFFFSYSYVFFILENDPLKFPESQWYLVVCHADAFNRTKVILLKWCQTQKKQRKKQDIIVKPVLPMGLY